MPKGSLAAHCPLRPGSVPFVSSITTEQRVVALVAGVLTNIQIAEALFVSRHTVGSHVLHVFANLGLTSHNGCPGRLLRPPALRAGRAGPASGASLGAGVHSRGRAEPLLPESHDSPISIGFGSGDTGGRG